MDIEAYLRRDYVTNLIKEGKRLDNRKFDEYRKLEINKGYVGEKADGSAYVSLGDTKVLVGISMDVGEPYPDAPTSGVMTVNAELRPMASPHFEAGPPGEEATELARVVDRGIRESGAIDTEKLFIEEDKVWVVFVDIHVLDHYGNMIDASGIGAIAALLDAKIPKYEDNKIIRGEHTVKLPVTCTPIPCTTAKIADCVIVDPDMDEEYAMDSRLTVATTDTINAMQKGGQGTLREEEVLDAIDLSFKCAKDIRRLVEGN
ncbi:MAG: exosome complex protein Rrp42 [Candidatus Altiarchaeota archaeon]|nr:exosome complex protein Rrp42 [Candidatus Altiarchaeota archaeon]